MPGGQEPTYLFNFLRLSLGYPLHILHTVNARRVAPVDSPTMSALAPVNIALVRATRIGPYSLSFRIHARWFSCRRVSRREEKEDMGGELDDTGKEGLSGAAAAEGWPARQHRDSYER
jgi:hypothetical protein